MIKVEVVYALLHKQEIIQLELDNKSTIKQAIELSGFLEKYPDIDVFSEDPNNKVGIFNQIKKIDTELSDGDRIEIYRELIANPKETRRKRAEKQREQGIVK